MKNNWKTLILIIFVIFFVINIFTKISKQSSFESQAKAVIESELNNID